MRVYGDHSRWEDPAEKLRRIQGGGSSHPELVDRLIEAGELWQGVADAELERDGCDRSSPAIAACASISVELARAVWRSWRGEPVHVPPLPRPPALPPRIRCKVAEGYAFYALYPETYAAAAARALPANARIIGIRSIGTSLAAMVAAGAGVQALPLSVRPVGHPFDRRLAVAEELRAELRAWASAGVPVAVVDEGPGLSGSSFAAVAEEWRRCGGAPGALRFFPGHLGALGHGAGEERRRFWAGAAKHAVSFEEEVLPRLRAGFARLEDLSGGAWRKASAAIPCIPWQERRKYRAGGWLLRFCGLGRVGREARARALTLAEAGFIPEIGDGWHGFLAQRWVKGTRPERVDVEHLARYLRFRARALPADRPGATADELLEAARTNAREALGVELNGIRAPRDVGPPVQVDGRMHAWEWIASPEGRIWKADAIDHCLGHDLVGAQPIAWDVAGAAVELSLGEGERASLARRLDVAREALAFWEVCYLGFQLGRALLGAQSVPEPERPPLRAAAAAYARRLGEVSGAAGRRSPAARSRQSPRR